VGYCADIADIGVTAVIGDACHKAAFDLADARATIEEVALDLSYARSPFLALRGYWMVAHQHSRLSLVDKLGTNVANNIRSGLQVTTEALGAAERARGALWHQFREFFTRHDCLLTPCMAVPPFPVEQNYPDSIAGRPMKTYIDWLAPTFILSLTGLPVASVPCGRDDQGLPVGMQVVGPPRGEELVLAVAAEIQRRCPIGLPSALF
jgi:amidase